MALYKYLPKQYLDEFFKRGSLKIGTLHEYRAIEKYGDAIGDDAEGTALTSLNIPGGGVIDLGSNSPEARFVREKFGIYGAPGAILQLGPNAGFNYREDTHDGYIYCTSIDYNPEVMKEFGGSCFEICKPDEFFKEVSRVIRHKAEFYDHGPIVYASRETEWTKPHKAKPFMLKAPRYAYQKENRAVWEARKATVKPLFVNVPNAVKYCRQIHRSR